MSHWWEDVPEYTDALDRAASALAATQTHKLIVEVVEASRKKGRFVQLVSRVGRFQFVDISARLDGAVLELWDPEELQSALTTGTELVVEGRWGLRPGRSELDLCITQISTDMVISGFLTQWRVDQENKVSAWRESNRSAVGLTVKSKDDLSEIEIGDRNGKSILVIGSETSRAASDLRRNSGAFVRMMQFSGSAIEGRDVERTSDDIAKRLENVNPEEYAVVVLARGGGGDAARLPFDSARVAIAILEAQQRGIRVICALGHEGDTHLCDTVAWRSESTPTNAGRLIRKIGYARQNRPRVPRAVVTPVIPEKRSERISPPRAIQRPPVREVAIPPQTAIAAQPLPVAPVQQPYPAQTWISVQPSKKRLWPRLVGAALIVALMCSAWIVGNRLDVVSAPRESATSTTAAPAWFATPSRNIICVGSGASIRCDINTVTYDMKTVPAQCVKTPNWGHVLVMDAKSARLACPARRNTVKGRDPVTTLRYGTSLAIGAATCTSSSAYLQCVRGDHGFRMSRSSYRVW